MNLQDMRHFMTNDIAPGVVENECLNIVNIENHAPANWEVIVSSPISGLRCAQNATYAVDIFILGASVDIAEEQKGENRSRG